MASVLGQVEREIVALERATEQLAADLEALYEQYLDVLGQSVQQQLIMASYHLCTQAYPAQFLALSLNRRQTLQQTLRKLGRQAQADLKQQIKCLREKPPILSDETSLVAASGLPPRLISEIAAAVKARIAEREGQDSNEDVTTEDVTAPETAPELTPESTHRDRAERPEIPELPDFSAGLSPEESLAHGSVPPALEAEAGNSLTSLNSETGTDHGADHMPTVPTQEFQAGDTDAGNTDAGDTDTGDTDAGDTYNGNTDTGNIDAGDTDNGNTDTGNTNTGNTDTGDTDAGNTEELESFLAQMISTTADPELSEAPAEESGPRSPMALARQHMRLEHQLRSHLRNLSQKANQAFKQAEILPDLPEPLLAAAAEAEAASDSPSKTPNLLDVLVEMSPDEISPGEISPDDISPGDISPGELNGDPEPKAGDKQRREAKSLDPSQMTHLVALNLRLSEIEFVDTKVSLWRTKIREQLSRLKRLGQQYQKKQRERAIAEAEAAWRSSWYED